MGLAFAVGTKQILWLLRLGLTFAAFGTALMCGTSVAGAIITVGFTAGIVALSTIEILGVLGIVFAGVVGIYSRRAVHFLQEPDSILFLVIGTAATLFTAGVLATFLKG